MIFQGDKNISGNTRYFNVKNYFQRLFGVRLTTAHGAVAVAVAVIQNIADYFNL